MPTDPLAELQVSHAQAIVPLHRRGSAEGFGLTPADLGLALHRSVSVWNTEARPAAIDESSTRSALRTSVQKSLSEAAG